MLSLLSKYSLFTRWPTRSERFSLTVYSQTEKLTCPLALTLRRAVSLERRANKSTTGSCTKQSGHGARQQPTGAARQRAAKQPKAISTSNLHCYYHSVVSEIDDRGKSHKEVDTSPSPLPTASSGQSLKGCSSGKSSWRRHSRQRARNRFTFSPLYSKRMPDTSRWETISFPAFITPTTPEMTLIHAGVPKTKTLCTSPCGTIHRLTQPIYCVYGLQSVNVPCLSYPSCSIILIPCIPATHLLFSAWKPVLTRPVSARTKLSVFPGISGHFCASLKITSRQTHIRK